jgi:hypothetical protein
MCTVLVWIYDLWKKSRKCQKGIKLPVLSLCFSPLIIILWIHYRKTENFKTHCKTSPYIRSRFTINNYGDCKLGDWKFVSSTSAIRQPQCLMLNCFSSLRPYPTQNTALVTKTNYGVRLLTYVALHVSLVSFFWFYQNRNVSKILVKGWNMCFRKIHLVEFRLLRAEIYTEKTKLIIAFCSCFVNMP